MDKRSKILDIAMNLNRVGNWAADGFFIKKTRILQFLDQTTDYLTALSSENFSKQFQETFNKFLLEYNTLKKEAINGPKDELLWAEKMMTWGNILTHRSKLLD